MPDTPGQLEAAEQLHTALVGWWPTASSVDIETLKKRFPTRRGLVAGWRLPDALPIEPRDLLVAIDEKFPWSLPLVALPNAVNGISYPHVESDGYLCMVPTGSSFTLPVGIAHVTQLVGEAVTLLEEGETRKNENDFYREAQSYWSLIEHTTIAAWLAERPPSGHRVWTSAVDKASGHFVIASSKDVLNSWAKSGQRRYAGTFEPALIVQLDAPLHPEQYPLTMKDLISLVEGAGASAELSMAVSRWRARKSLPIVLTFEHENARVYLGAMLLAPKQVRMPGLKHSGIPGFRQGSQGKLRSRLQALRLVPNRFPHFKVTEVHREFLHNRTAGETAAGLKSSHVVVIGCGAIGGQLSVHLAQAGVGKLTLVDADVLSWQNVGRHVLGGHDVGYAKAVALESLIKRSFPDAEVSGVTSKWEDWIQKHLAQLVGADLVISVTGEPASNHHLDALISTNDMPPVLFGWMEPFGTAAHAVFCYPASRRLCDITDERGLLAEPVVDLDTALELPREPSCGAFYQPYSSLSSLNSTALIGELALDALLGRVSNSVHRVWVGDVNEFSRNSLSLKPNWLSRINEFGDCRRYQFVI